MVFSAYSISNSIGPEHAENQDSFLSDQEDSLFAVADGVGGYAGAKEASSLAIEGLKERAFLLSNDVASFESVLKEIHEDIQQKADRLHLENMGTTIAVAKVFPDSNGLGGAIITANVGDSPILFFPSREDAKCVPVYTDDSHRDQDPYAFVGIIQYLGLPDWKVDVHTHKFSYSSDDMLLLCSDGVTDNLADRSQKDRNQWSKLETLAKESRSAQRITESAISVGIKADDMTAILLLL